MKKLNVIQETAHEEFSFKSLSDFARPIYLDNNATTQVDDDAISAMLRVLEKNYANPSAQHEAGQDAKREIENARKHVANFLGCLTEEVIFTSGGTESINTVINSVIKTEHFRCRIITCETEHGATLNKLKDIGPKYDVLYLNVDKTGVFELEQLEKWLEQKPGLNLLVSIMAANNETGTIHQNIYEAIKLAHEYGALFHVDAVQIAGKMPIQPYIKAGVDFLTISGHKFHSPKGIGCIYIKKGTPFYPTILGGYQEYNYRAGTENIPGIAALGAIAAKKPVYTEQTQDLHKKFIELLSKSIPSCIINGGGVPGTINVGFKYVHREAMVIRLSQNGVYASVGSACAKGIEPSHVLKAMNVPQEYIHGSVRFSFSKYTTNEEIDRAIEVITKTYLDIRKLSLGVVP